MVAIVDYDAGNLKSVQKAFQYLGEEVLITRDKEKLLLANHLVLPGVGSFGDAMSKIHSFQLTEILQAIAKSGKPFLGICLGMQLLFSSSEESPGVAGLSILKGEVVQIPKREGLKIPHMGWNSIQTKSDAALFAGIQTSPYVYFVHSYYLKAKEDSIVAASTDYSTHIHASVEEGNIFGCQFHPEKSGETGLKILKNFISVSTNA